MIVGYQGYCYQRDRITNLTEILDLRPSNQYILVRVIPSSFRFTKICLCQVSSSNSRAPLLRKVDNHTAIYEPIA
jgi:hypothetical protein